MLANRLLMPLIVLVAALLFVGSSVAVPVIASPPVGQAHAPLTTQLKQIGAQTDPIISGRGGAVLPELSDDQQDLGVPVAVQVPVASGDIYGVLPLEGAPTPNTGRAETTPFGLIAVLAAIFIATGIWLRRVRGPATGSGKIDL